MHPSKLTLTIDNFDNAAMADNPQYEVARILSDLADAVRKTDPASAFKSFKPRDTNGNIVGYCSCTTTDNTTN